MIEAPSRDCCAVCGDRVGVRHEAECGRCHRLVCRACSHARGRTHETVLCLKCAGAPEPTGWRATPVYRTWQRLRAG